MAIIMTKHHNTTFMHLGCPPIAPLGCNEAVAMITLGIAGTSCHGNRFTRLSWQQLQGCCWWKKPFLRCNDRNGDEGFVNVPWVSDQLSSLSTMHAYLTSYLLTWRGGKSLFIYKWRRKIAQYHRKALCDKLHMQMGRVNNWKWVPERLFSINARASVQSAH